MDVDARGPGHSSGALTLRLEHLPTGVVVRTGGCLDRTTAPRLQQVFDEQLGAAPGAIVIDLSALCVLAPDAVPGLVRVAYRAGEADVGLCLVTTDRTVNGVLAAAGVHDLFEIHRTVNAGLRALSPARIRPS